MRSEEPSDWNHLPGHQSPREWGQCQQLVSFRWPCASPGLRGSTISLLSTALGLLPAAGMESPIDHQLSDASLGAEGLPSPHKSPHVDCPCPVVLRACGPQNEGQGLGSRRMVLGAVGKSLPLTQGLDGWGCGAPGHAQHSVRCQGADSKL